MKWELCLCGLLSALVFSACGDNLIEENLPRITSVEVYDITDNSARLDGHFDDLHVRLEHEVTYIFRLSDNADMEIFEEFKHVESDLEIFPDGYYSVSLSGLEPSTEYWYQFVITDGIAEISSEVFSFRTSSGMSDGFDTSVEEALELPDGTSVELTGVVVAVNQRGFLLSDEEGNILYIYAGAGWVCNVHIGDRVIVDGTMDTYNGNREVLLIDVEYDSAADVPYSDVYMLSENNLSGFASAGYEPRKVIVTGELSFDGYYYNIQVGKSPIVVSLIFPAMDMDDYVGEYVSVTGYYIYTSLSSAQETIVSIIPIGISVADRPENDSIDTSAASDLNSTGETANCYIVSKYGTYKFDPVKGNSNESVGSVASVEVLWESFGTSVTPEVGDLIDAVEYKNGHVYFRTDPSYREGNAVIAAKNSSGTILWSWHIWLTDQPEEQVYYNNAGTMMDRNLGATSATPGDVGALGLLYQWGRKDPFLGSYHISINVTAASTLSWPSPVSSSSDNGTINFSIRNPTTFISQNNSNDDWYYTGDSSTDNTRWQSDKTIYDPCPAGWQVPDADYDYGVWSMLPLSTWFYSDTNKGINFSGMFGSDSSIWYPAAGELHYNFFMNTGDVGYYWSVTPWDDYHVTYLFFYDSDLRLLHAGHGKGFSVRCYKIGSGKSDSESGTEDMGNSEYEW
ncbi:MAG: hypothetical protein IJ394_04685 [Bacteroidales bacterium]|nr:hypothetical protein [Bacteroidales bacterium]